MKRTMAMKLLDAAAHGDLENVVHLIDNLGVNVNIADDKKRTSLHFACNGGHLEVVRILLDRGALIDAKDVNANTALHLGKLLCDKSMKSC
jgi:ankyrin repeat protein